MTAKSTGTASNPSNFVPSKLDCVAKFSNAANFSGGFNFFGDARPGEPPLTSETIAAVRGDGKVRMLYRGSDHAYLCDAHVAQRLLDSPGSLAELLTEEQEELFTAAKIPRDRWHQCLAADGRLSGRKRGATPRRRANEPWPSNDGQHDLRVNVQVSTSVSASSSLREFYVGNHQAPSGWTKARLGVPLDGGVGESGGGRRP